MTIVVVVVVMLIMIEHTFIRMVLQELVLVFTIISPQIIQLRFLQTIISSESQCLVTLLVLMVFILVGVVVHKEIALDTL